MNIAQQWYTTTMKYARDHYNKGWDFFVEGVDYSDFERVIADHNFANYDEVFDYYCQLTVDRLEAMEEARADCGWDDEQADGDALASAGWGTDEDYGYFGGDE